MNPTQWAAWVGASSGVGGLLWNVYTKLTSGPKLNLTVTPGLMRIPDTHEGRLYIAARVRNVGTAKTTITNMCFAAYDSSWKKFRRRSTADWVVASPSPTQPVPFKLEVGEEWSGMAIQDDKMQRAIDGGNLWCAIYHSWSRRPIQERVVPSKLRKK
jgi:hypothetical protein